VAECYRRERRLGVAGVQFQLDGRNIDVEDTMAPFDVSWDTATATAGTHLLTAIARDAAGNRAISARVTVSVSNGPDTTPPVISAVTASGCDHVVRDHHLDDERAQHVAYRVRPHQPLQPRVPSGHHAPDLALP
jgi:hypothetical protein